ncbi:MAG: hypothetical protein HFACDABA_02345 [Anaerolineales bacterium]|nr:hypothetical protein [Anaerolineales bacterium]
MRLTERDRLILEAIHAYDGLLSFSQIQHLFFSGKSQTEYRLKLLNEALELEALAQVKFFTPDAGWTWYASEFDGKDIFFGLVSGLEVELGYFALSELEEIRGPMGLPIERDLHFEPTTLKKVD